MKRKRFRFAWGNLLIDPFYATQSIFHCELTRMAIDRKQLRKKIVLRLLAHPLTMIPFVSGITALMASWTFNWHPGLGVFAGLAGALGGGGMFVTQLLLRGDSMAREAIAEIEREERRRVEAALDDLDARLALDGDARTETALRDLRTVVKAFEDPKLWEHTLAAGSEVDVRSRVNELCQQSIQSLEQSLKLWQMIQQIRSPHAREPIQRQREETIVEVLVSIKHLSETLVGIQTLSHGTRGHSELNRIRDELDQSLAIARKVEERMKLLVKESELRALG